MEQTKTFWELLRKGSKELFEDHPELMATGDLQPSPNEVHAEDVDLFFRGLEEGLITMHRGARFNTRDRGTRGGRWGLLSRGREGGWFNAEYLPQIAAYVQAILELGFHQHRVHFELPQRALQLDLCISDESGAVVVLGEAKRETRMLDRLVGSLTKRFATENPGKKGGAEAQQLAWRLWTTRAPYLWLIGPGQRVAYRVSYDPLRLEVLEDLPAAKEMGLEAAPPVPLMVPDLA